MTISNETCVVTVTGTGAQTIFNYGFLVPTTAGFELIQTDLTTGEQVTIDTSEYSVSGLGNAAGGTFTYPLIGSPIPTTKTLTFARQVAYTQTTNFTNQGGYYPAAVEAALDNLAMQIQQLKARLDRCIQQPLVDTVLSGTLPAAFQREDTELTFNITGAVVLLPLE